MAITLNLPSSWASLLINNDISGYDAKEVDAITACLAANGLTMADCLCDGDSLGYMRHHDASGVMPLLADCSEFIFVGKEVQP